MTGNAEADHFRRIELHAEVERATHLVASYRRGIDHYRNQMRHCFIELGRIAERLGEPDDRGT